MAPRVPELAVRVFQRQFLSTPAAFHRSELFRSHFFSLEEKKIPFHHAKFSADFRLTEWTNKSARHGNNLRLGRAPAAVCAQQFKAKMTSAFQDAILGHIARNDPAPADAIDVFFNIWMYQEATLPQYADALKELKDLGLIEFAGCEGFRLTENGRRHVRELIKDALLELLAVRRIGEA